MCMPYILTYKCHATREDIVSYYITTTSSNTVFPLVLEVWFEILDTVLKLV